MTLYNYRNSRIMDVIKRNKIKSVADFGCGDGKLLFMLAKEKYLKHIAGVDLSEKRINKLRTKFNDNCRIDLYCCSFLNYNPVFERYEAIVLSEVIEHLPDDAQAILLDLILNRYKPRIFILTTPNRSYNANLEVLYNGLRHASHLFEFSDEDVKHYTDRMRRKYPSYAIQNGYCDPDKASHLILFEKRDDACSR